MNEKIVALFDQKLSSHPITKHIDYRTLEYHEYDNGMSQVLGSPADVMKFIGYLVDNRTGINLVEAWTVREEK